MVEHISKSLSVSDSQEPDFDQSLYQEVDRTDLEQMHQDFQAMLEADSSDSIGDAAFGSSDVIQLVRSVETGKANMQSALLRASLHAESSTIQAAAVAMSRYDLQTLLLSKIANKTFQAVDRLTNLQ